MARRADSWQVVGPRPAFTSPPLALSSVMVSGIEFTVTNALCSPWSKCRLRRLLAETTRWPTWRVYWLAAGQDLRDAPFAPFAVPPTGRRKVAFAPVADYRWFATGTIRRLIIEPPPDGAPFEIEAVSLISRSDRGAWSRLGGR